MGPSRRDSSHVRYYKLEGIRRTFAKGRCVLDETTQAKVLLDDDVCKIVSLGFAQSQLHLGTYH
jgi:hypothetical protein